MHVAGRALNLDGEKNAEADLGRDDGSDDVVRPGDGGQACDKVCGAVAPRNWRNYASERVPGSESYIVGCCGVASNDLSGGRSPSKPAYFCLRGARSRVAAFYGFSPNGDYFRNAEVLAAAIECDRRVGREVVLPGPTCLLDDLAH